jgi:hypothetical protein
LDLEAVPLDPTGSLDHATVPLDPTCSLDLEALPLDPTGSLGFEAVPLDPTGSSTHNNTGCSKEFDKACNIAAYSLRSLIPNAVSFI